MSNIALTKASNPSDIERYFRGILELDKQNKEFSVNLDDVWQLCYAEKGKAVRALKSNFIENVDFIVIAQNGKNPDGGRPTDDYYLTSVAFNRILMKKGVIHEATRPSRDKNKPWKWKVLNKGFEGFGQNIQDPNFQSQTQIKWYDNRFRALLSYVGIEVPQSLGF